jgi:hypothetical protein
METGEVLKVRFGAAHGGSAVGGAPPSSLSVITPGAGEGVSLEEVDEQAAAVK